ncbi:MAG: triose-phosphate isomerase [Parcubacteria group bacterium]|nr:triose-phosphate isomerase [Parcubacteria group bacterium]
MKLIVGNWKLNPATLNEAVALVSAVSVSTKSELYEQMVLLPPFVFLEELVKKFRQVQWGAQDVFWEQEGAYTGEISLPMLKDIGVNWVLVGHSERRRLFGETDETVNTKVLSALGQGFKVIVAVGELQRDDDEEVVISSFKNSISGAKLPASAKASAGRQAPRSKLQDLIVAYEPVWAISTNPGAVADDPMRSNQIIGRLKNQAYKMFGQESKNIRFLYGGSVNTANAAGFLAQPNIDGALVGGASLKAEEFSQIINTATSVS